VQRGVLGLAEDLRRQHGYLRERTPAYAAVLEHVANELSGKLGAELAAVWQDRAFLAFYDRPLLLLASLRFDALSEGPTHPLWSAIGDQPTNSAPSEDDIRAAFDAPRARFWDSLARRTVQTNETTRAVAWLWPAHVMAEVDASVPVHVVDVGTSAGLNLVADDLPLDWVDADGQPLELLPLPPIATRLGFDLSPLDVTDDDAVRWLHACVWPSDSERLARLDLAISAFHAARERGCAPELEACPIHDVPQRVSEIGLGQRLLVVQTIMRDYVPADAWQAYALGLRALLTERPAGSMVWMELEVDGQDQQLGSAAVVRAHVADREANLQTLVLARTHPHPRRLFVAENAVRELGAALAAGQVP
jgi:hypothetical protein